MGHLLRFCFTHIYTVLFFTCIITNIFLYYVSYYMYIGTLNMLKLEFIYRATEKNRHTIELLIHD